MAASAILLSVKVKIERTTSKTSQKPRSSQVSSIGRLSSAKVRGQ